MGDILKKPSRRMIAFFILPGMVIFVFAIVVPSLTAIIYSLFDWTNMTSPKWTGIDNYKRLITDVLFWSSLWNNLKLALYTLIGQLGIGYFMAFVLHTGLVRARGFYRTVLFFPVIISTVVLGFLWLLMYSNDYGILNTLFRTAGLEGWSRAWLSDPKIVVEVLAVPLIWQWFGFYMVIFMGALGTIPADVLESAEIDGCSSWQKMIHIMVPMTYNTIVVAVLLCLSGIMKIFDHVLVMTAGGPGNSSMVLALYSYKITFTGMQIGYGNTISVGTVVFSLLISFTARKLLGGSRYE